MPSTLRKARRKRRSPLSAPVASLIVALLTTGALPSGASAAPGLCKAGEKILFSCRIGRAAASICGADKEAVQYRFGRPGAPQLVLPGGSATSGMVTLLGGGGAYAAFAAGPFRYVVYSSISHGREKAGVAVEKNGRLIRNMRCAGRAESELGPDLFGSYGFSEDKQGFDIP